MTTTKFVLGLLCACLFTFGVYLKGYSDSNSKHAQEAADAQIAFNRRQEEERDNSQKALADISKQWQAYLQTQSAMADRTISGLRNDGVRLSVELADARVCAVTGNCGPITNGRAELSDNASRFFIGQAQRADAQVKALQQTINELQRRP